MGTSNQVLLKLSSLFNSAQDEIQQATDRKFHLQ